MSVIFTESRALPREVKAMGHYRAYGDGNMNTETAVADIFKSLTQGAVDFFGGSSSASKQAAAQAASMQAQVYGEQADQRAKTVRTVILAGAGLVGVLVLVVALKRPSARVSGYRRRTRRARR